MISFAAEREAEVRAIAARHHAPIAVIGATGGRRLQIFQGATRLVDQFPVSNVNRTPIAAAL